MSSPSRLRLINTFESPVPLYRDVLPRFAERAAEIEILISDFAYREGRSSLEQIFKTCELIRVTRIPCGPRPTGKFGKLWAHMTFSLGVVLRTLTGRAAVNVFLTQPPLFFVWGSILKACRGQAYCVVVMDLYPDAAVAAGMLKGGGILDRIFRWVCRVGLRHADHIVVIGRCMEERVRRGGNLKGRVHLVTNWAKEGRDPSFSPLEATSNLRSELGLLADFTVLYSGNAGRLHCFEALLRAIRRLDGETDAVKFLCVGGGARWREIQENLALHRVSNVHFLPYQPEEKLTDVALLGDVHFVSLRSGAEGVVVPSKTYTAWAVGRPVIYEGESSGEIARTIAEKELGEVIRPGAEEQLDEAIVRLWKRPEYRDQVSGRALRESRTTFSKESAVREYSRVLAELLGNPSRDRADADVGLGCR